MIKYPIEWAYNIALTSGASIVIETGIDNSGAQTTVPVMEATYLTYGLQSELGARIIVAGSTDFAFGTSDILLQHDAAPGVYTTPYLLPPPINQTGYILITKPFIRITLEDLATSVHSYTRFYAKAWA